jgi:hypothetical protein
MKSFCRIAIFLEYINPASSISVILKSIKKARGLCGNEQWQIAGSKPAKKGAFLKPDEGDV